MTGRRTMLIAAGTAALAACGTARSSTPPPTAGMEWLVWHLQASNPATATITVVIDNDIAPDPGCTMPTKLITRETATTVEIGLEGPVPPNLPCGGVGIHRVYTVHLKKALGSREIVDPASP